MFIKEEFKIYTFYYYKVSLNLRDFILYNIIYSIGGEPKPYKPMTIRPEGAGVARTIAMWVFGLLASAIIGGFAGTVAGNLGGMSPYAATEAWGACAGMLTFACLRLWLAAPSKTSK